MFAESENLIMNSINQDQYHASISLTADGDLKFKGCINDSLKILDTSLTPLFISFYHLFPQLSLTKIV